jgi:putative membrane protein
MTVSLASGIAWANASPSQAVPPTVAVVPDMTEADAVAKLAENSLAQAKLAKLALAKSGSIGVRTFVERVLDEHQRAYQELERIALARGMPFPGEEAGNQKALYRQLAVLFGAEFDRAYMAQASQAHHDMVATLRSIHTDDPALQNFVARTLPKAQIQAADARNNLSTM